MKTNEELVQEASSLMYNVKDGFSFFEDIDESHRLQLMQDARARLGVIFAKLNEAYNPIDKPLKSVVELAEYMTLEDFKKLKVGDIVEYDRITQQVRTIDELDGTLFLHISGWKNFDSCKLIK